jgi:hypothetical protein
MSSHRLKTEKKYLYELHIIFQETDGKLRRQSKLGLLRYLSSPLGQGLPRVLEPPAVIRILAVAPGPVLAFRPRIILLPAAGRRRGRVVRIPRMRLLREVVRIFAVAASAIAASRPAASGRAAAASRRRWTFLTRRFFARRFLLVAVQVVGGRNHRREDDLASGTVIRGFFAADSALIR